MSITFKQTIIHNLDLSYAQPIISKGCIILTDETESFITRKIIKVLEDQGVCEGKFKEQMSLYPEDDPHLIIKNWEDDKFKHTAEILAERFYRYMLEYGTIASGDLIITNFIMNAVNYLGIIKLNFKEGVHTHFYNNEDGVMKLIQHKGTYDSKVIEAAVINIDEVVINLLDGTKSKYLSLLFDVDTKLSVKEKLKVIDNVTNEVIKDHYDNPIQAIGDLKNNITESLSRTNSINIVQVVEQTFGGNEEILQACKSKLEEYGLHEEQPIEVTGSKLFSKYANQKLKTDTGIEVKMPTHIFKDIDFFEIVSGANGTMNLVIKNVSQVVNK